MFWASRLHNYTIAGVRIPKLPIGVLLHNITNQSSFISILPILHNTPQHLTTINQAVSNSIKNELQLKSQIQTSISNNRSYGENQRFSIDKNRRHRTQTLSSWPNSWSFLLKGDWACALSLGSLSTHPDGGSNKQVVDKRTRYATIHNKEVYRRELLLPIGRQEQARGPQHIIIINHSDTGC